MISPKLTEAYESGRAEAARLTSPEGRYAGVQYAHDAARCLANVIGCTTEHVVSEVARYHKERLDAVPDLTMYPELRGYRERLVEHERGLREGGLTESDIALRGSLNFWRDTRLLQETGRGHFVLPQPEKCRVVYMAASDRGPLHAKNVDDPITYWQPEPPVPAGSPWPWQHPLWFDGVGSGLHIDEIPPEIFPVDALTLCREHCSTVSEATDFLVKYNYFWSSMNIIVHNAGDESAALEKTRCRVAVRHPNRQGISYITGMGALDPEISAFQKQQRQKFLDQENLTWDDSLDGCFFQVCERKWINMTRYVDELSVAPTFDNLKQLMEQRDPSGPMCLTGTPCHRNDITPGCTLIMRLITIAQKQMHSRQWRGSIPAYLDTPEIVQYN